MYNLLKLKNFIQGNIYPISIVILSLGFLLFQLFLFRDQSWESYSYVHQDFWRRMEDAQFYLGLRETGQFHPPIASIIYSTLISLGVNQLYLINWIGYSLFGILLYFIFKKVTGSSKASFFSSALYITNFSIIQQSNYLGLYDLFTSFLITLAVFIFLIRDRESKIYLIVSGITLGIAGLTQYSGVFAAPFIVLFLILEKEASLKQKITNVVLLLIPMGVVFGSFFLYRWIEFSNPLYSNVEQFGFLKPGISNIGFYLLAALSFFKIPVIIIALVGVGNTWKNKTARMFAAFTLPVGLFFVFIYVWGDSRFLTYFIPVIYLFTTYGFIYINNLIKNKKYIMVPAYIILALIFIYNNLYNQGNFGIVVSRNDLLSLDVKYESGIPEYRVKTINTQHPLKPYFLLNNDFNERTEFDSELSYFMNTTSYHDILRIKDIVNNENYVLILENERFVRYHQFNVAFRKNSIMDPTNEELSKAKFVVSDHPITEAHTTFSLIKTFNNLFLYSRIE